MDYLQGKDGLMKKDKLVLNHCSTSGEKLISPLAFSHIWHAQNRGTVLVLYCFKKEGGTCIQLPE